MQRWLLGLFILVIIAFSILFVLRKHDSSSPADQGGSLSKGGIDLSSSRFEEWIEYSSPTNKFHALFPTLPQHTNKVERNDKTNEVRNQEVYLSVDHDGTLYMVYLITFENKEAAKDVDDSIVKGVIDEILAKSPDGKKLNVNKVMKNGKIVFQFEMIKDDIVAKGEAFSHGNTLYIIDVISKSNVWNPSEYEFFVNSLDTEKDNEKNKQLK